MPRSSGRTRQPRPPLSPHRPRPCPDPDLPRCGSTSAISASSNGPSANLHQKIPKILICLADRGGMTRVDTTPATGRQDPDRDGPPNDDVGAQVEVGARVVITVVAVSYTHLRAHETDSYL